jgi:hypothetical protein
MRTLREVKRREEKPTRLGRVQRMLANLERDFQRKPPAATVADLIRLMQLERELEEGSEPEEIVVRWEDPER